MKVDVGTVLIKMVEVICVWRVVSGSTGTWGESTVSLCSRLYFLPKIFPKCFGMGVLTSGVTHW